MEQKLLNLVVDAVQVMCELAKEEAVVVVAAAEFGSVAVVDGVVPCGVVPILSLHLADFHRPFQQIPWESCMAGFHH